MNSEQTCAEEIIKFIKAQKQPQESIYTIENNIENGFVVVKYQQLMVEERVLLDGEISMCIPKDFEMMEEDLAEMKYPGEDKPDYIYTNEDTTVNLTFSIDDDGEISDEEVVEVRDILAKEMKRIYPATTIEDMETIEANHKSISYFAFEVPLIDGNVYNFMFFMEVNDALLLGNFNCSVYEKKEWKIILKQMLTTLKVVDMPVTTTQKEE
ncbi:MAG: hypothetical protein AB9856_06945 [Cellulosilyticaceae bacterium]